MRTPPTTFLPVALAGVGEIIAVLSSSVESNQCGFILATLILAFAFFYVLSVIAEFFTIRSRIQGLQGTM